MPNLVVMQATVVIECFLVTNSCEAHRNISASFRFLKVVHHSMASRMGSHFFDVKGFVSRNEAFPDLGDGMANGIFPSSLAGISG